MTATILALAGAYGFVLAVLVGIFAFARVHPVWHILAAVIAAGLFLLTYRQIGELRGLPSDAPPPRFFQLHWARIVEPNKLSGEIGKVFLWLEELDEKNYPSGEPRAYMVPYSTDLVQKIEGAMAQIKAGESVAGEITAQGEAEDTAERLADEVDKTGASTGQGGSVGERFLSFDFGEMGFVALPAPITPDKGL